MNMPGFFVADPDFRLPHPSIPLRVILIAHLALSRAFQLLRAKTPIGLVLATAKEDEITLEVYQLLEDGLLGANIVPGFDRRRFRNVVRAPDIRNYDGTHPSKQPDLVMFLMKREHLSVRPSQDALFAECKPVDDDHPIGGDYCDKGIRRFITGDYAWAMQDGMMVAYVRGGRSIGSHLAPVLAGSRHKVLGFPDAPVAIGAVDAHEPLHFTVHQRSFEWQDGCGSACAIKLFHSWHDCA